MTTLKEKYLFGYCKRIALKKRFIKQFKEKKILLTQIFKKIWRQC